MEGTLSYFQCRPSEERGKSCALIVVGESLWMLHCLDTSFVSLFSFHPFWRRSSAVRRPYTFGVCVAAIPLVFTCTPDFGEPRIPLIPP